MIRPQWSLRALTVVWAIWVFFHFAPLALAESVEEAAKLNARVVQMVGQGKFAEALPLAQKVLEIRQNYLGEKHPDTAIGYNNLGLIYKSMGDYGKAEPLYLKALEIDREVLGEKHTATATRYNNLGALYEVTGNYAKAEPFFQKALEVRIELLGEKHPDTASTYNNLGTLYVSIGNYGKAEPFLVKALAIYRATLGEKHTQTAMSYYNLGQVHYFLGEYAKAEPLYLKALEIRKEVLGEKHPVTALNYNHLGELYRVMGDYAKAETLLQKAMAIDREGRGEKHLDIASTYNNLGNLYGSMRDFAKAEPYLKKALEIRTQALGENNPDTAQSHLNLGEFYRAVGDYGKAEPHLKKALEIRRKALGEKHPATATSYNNLGTLYLDLGDYAKAESHLKKTLEIDIEALGEKSPNTGIGYSNLSELYRRMGDYTKAETFCRKALEIKIEVLGVGHRSTLETFINLGFIYLHNKETDRAFEIFTKLDSPSGLGDCYLARGDYEKARAEFESALGLSEKEGAKDFIIGDNIGLGLAHEGLGNYSDAKKHFLKAIEIMESQRAELGASSRESYLSGQVAGYSRIDAYEGLIRVILKENQKGYEKEAFRICERVKSRVFIEMLATRAALGRSEPDRKVLSRDRDFRVKLTALQKQISIFKDLGNNAPKGRKEEAQKELGETSKQYESFLEEVKLSNAELASLLTVDVPEVEILQGLLDADATLLEYFIGKEKTYAWLMTRDDVKMFEIPAGEEKVEVEVNEILLPNISNLSRSPEPVIVFAPSGSDETTADERNRNRERFLDAAKEVYQTLFLPLKEEIGTKLLIVVPHGPLHKLPISALYDGSHYLAEQYDITTLPSASVIPYVVEKRKTDIGGLLALGNPKTDYMSLESAEQEVDEVAKLFPKKQVYIRDKATKLLFEKESPSAGVIHLASHGEFNDRQPLQSGLILAKEANDDGRLRVHEVFGLDLKNANLVTLSACRTALGKVTTGDDMVGLSRAFIYAGTPALLASLWKVEDTSTSILMERFYESWLNGKMSKPEALRQAQLSVKAMPEYQHPFYWAPFVLIGDWK